jgi:hypothetical protein
LFSAQKSSTTRLIFLGNFHVGPSLCGVLAQPADRGGRGSSPTFSCPSHHHLPGAPSRRRLPSASLPHVRAGETKHQTTFFKPPLKWRLADSPPSPFNFETKVFQATLTVGRLPPPTPHLVVRDPIKGTPSTTAPHRTRLGLQLHSIMLLARCPRKDSPPPFHHRC